MIARGCSVILFVGVLLVPPAAAAEPLWSGGFEAGWEKSWQVHKDREFGMKTNARVGRDARFAQVLRIEYPKGSASPAVVRKEQRPLGGAQFVADLGIAPRDALHLRYWVRFAADFDFVKGGKLPGLYGGTAPSGGTIPDGKDGFSTRFMWRAKGDGEVYAYLPSSEKHGTSLGRGNWRFQPGKWYLLEQAVTLNTPDKKDGRIQVWFDEKLVLDEKGLVFRTAESLKAEGIFFSTFFGGDDSSWATPNTTYADFAGFAVGSKYLGP